MPQVYDSKSLVEELEDIRNCVVIIGSVVCGPCNTLKKNLDYSERVENIKIIYAEASAVPEYCLANLIMSVPTSLFYRDGEVVFKHNGSCTRKTFERMIRTNINGR